MQFIRHLVLGFLVVTPLLSNAHSQVVEEAIVLRYKPVGNLCYLVDRTFKWVKNRDEKNAEARHQRAIIKYGKSSMLDTGVIRLTPKVHLLSEEGKWDRLRAEFWPVKSRFPTGKWTDSWRWQEQAMARDYDMYPLFLQRHVKAGDSWKIVGKLLFPCLKCRVDGKITHRLEGIETIDGVKCAKIRYGLSASLNTGEHPEMLVDTVMKQTKPAYTVKVEGTAYFDPQKGIIVRQNHYAESTHRWTGKLDRKFVRRYPHWRKQVHDLHTSRITVELISSKEASRLIKEAEDARAKAATKPVQPVLEKGPRWKYLVERTTKEQDNLTKKENVFIDRAFVYYGVGAKRAGGQIKTVPQVVYIDKAHKRLTKAIYHGSAIIPFGSEKFTMISKFPEDIGADQDHPAPVLALPRCFATFPMKPTVELRKGLSWASTIHTYYGWSTKLKFPTTSKHVVKGYEQKQGRMCAVIKYTITGDFKCADHPDLFTKEQLREFKAEYHLSGNGTAYFDPADGIIVEKDQTVSWTTLSKQLKRLKDGKIGWVRTQDRKDSVRIQVSIQPTNKQGKPGEKPPAAVPAIDASKRPKDWRQNVNEAQKILDRMAADLIAIAKDKRRPADDRIAAISLLGRIGNWRALQFLVSNVSLKIKPLVGGGYIGAWRPCRQTLVEIGLRGAEEIFKTLRGRGTPKVSEEDMEHLAFVLRGIFRSGKAAQAVVDAKVRDGTERAGKTAERMKQAIKNLEQKASTTTQKTTRPRNK